MRDYLKKKRSGKDVEDIAHFFLSPVQAPESKPVSTEKKRPIILPGNLHRIIAVISQTPKIPTIFWSSQIASTLTRCGKRVLVIDVGTEPEKLGYVLNSVTIHPTLGDLLNQTDKSITVEGPGGFRMLAFQLQMHELNNFKDEEREILFQTLRKEEQQSDVVLLNIHFDQMNADLISYLQSLHETVLIVSPEDLFGAYRMLKILFLCSARSVCRISGIWVFRRCISGRYSAAGHGFKGISQEIARRAGRYWWEYVSKSKRHAPNFCKWKFSRTGDGGGL